MSALRLLAASCLTAVLFTASASAWDSLGHMLITQIASDQLTPEAKVAVDQSLSRFNEDKKSDRPGEPAAYDIVTASCWMDDARAMPEKYSFSPWHYVNLPYTPEGLPEPDGGKEPNVIWAINHCTDIIEGKAADPAVNRDQALVMLLHLEGDAHQPLHTTNRGGDLGGNRVTLENEELSKEEKLFGKSADGNLHAFWDSSYRRIFSDGKAKVAYEAPFYDKEKPIAGHASASAIIRREASAIGKKYPPTFLTDQKDPEGWAHESHAVGYELGYGKLSSDVSPDHKAKLNEHYVTAARDAAEQRIAMAGYRLGAMLNRLYGGTAETPVP